MNSALLETASQKQVLSQNPSMVPEHVAIIMDGNRRWAKNRDLPSIVGHWKGAETLTRMTRAAKEVGVKVLTVYAFSTENWNRSYFEVEALMRLLKSYLLRQRSSMLKEGVRLQTIGNIDKLPSAVRAVLLETIEMTKGGGQLDLVIALSYGGRDEICRAIHNIIDDCQSGHLSKNEVTEETISSYLDTAKWKDPDLLIRTSGENRISNFLLWQISYCEVFVSDVLWPEFKKKDLEFAIEDYQKRNQRLGQ